MAEELAYRDEAAAGYDRAFAQPTLPSKQSGVRLTSVLRTEERAPSCRLRPVAGGITVAIDRGTLPRSEIGGTDRPLEGHDSPRPLEASCSDVRSPVRILNRTLRAGRPYVLELSHVRVGIRRIMSHPIDADDRLSQVTILIKPDRALYRLQVRRLDSGRNVGAADGLPTLDDARNRINDY